MSGRRGGTSRRERELMASVDAAPFHGSIPRGRDSRMGGRDFHAQWPGICGLCKERYEAGVVIVRTVRGYVHSPLCPRDLPPEDEAEA